MTKLANRRRSPRIDVEVALELVADDHAHDVITRDVNDRGAMVFSRVGYPAGTHFIVGNHAGWSTSAQVIWSRVAPEPAVSPPPIIESWKVVFAIGLEFGERQPAFWKHSK